MTTLSFRLKCSEILGHSDKHPYILSAPIFPLISYSFLWILYLSWALVSFPSSRRTFLNSCGILHLDTQLPFKCNKSKPSLSRSLAPPLPPDWLLLLLVPPSPHPPGHQSPLSPPRICSSHPIIYGPSDSPPRRSLPPVSCMPNSVNTGYPVKSEFQKNGYIFSIYIYIYIYQFSRSVMSHSLQPHEPQHARPPCPSPTPRVYPNSCPLSQWCHLTISSSVVPFSSCHQSFPTSGSFPRSQPLTSGGQILEFQLQHQSLQWTPRTGLL